MKKRMKKQRMVIVSSLLIFLMFFGLWGCGRTQTPPAAVTLYDRGLEVVGLMAEMAGSEDYMGLLTGSSEITERIQTAAQGDYSVPERVYAVSAGAGTFAAGAEMDSFSEGLQTLLKNRSVSALGSQINGMDGAECLAAANTCMAQTTFVSDSADREVLYLYLFQKGVPAAVAFMPGADGTVAASGTLILADGLEWNSAEDIRGYFENMGLQTEVSEVFPEDS